MPLREKFDFRGYARLPRFVAAAAVLVAIPVLYGIWQDTARLGRVTETLAAEEQRLDARDKALAAALRAQRLAAGKTRNAPQANPGSVMTVLSHLETAWDKNIGLRQIDVDATIQRARIQLATQSVDSLIAYTDRLKQTSARVVLERHATLAAQPPKWSLEAHLTADWQ